MNLHDYLNNTLKILNIIQFIELEQQLLEHAMEYQQLHAAPNAPPIISAEELRDGLDRVEADIAKAFTLFGELGRCTDLSIT